MAEPGWYNAAGDPASTRRYWDGNQWIGDPVFEPPPDPVSAPPPPHGGYTYGGGPVVAPVRFSAALKTVAIVVSVLKAIPLVLALIAAIFLAAASRSIDDDFGELGFGLDGLVGAAIAVIVFFVAFGALLVGFQFVGALKERPLMVFIPALIMSLIDVLLAIGSWSAWNQARNSVFENESPGGAFMMTAVAAAQIYIAVQAIRANGQ